MAGSRASSELTSTCWTSFLTTTTPRQRFFFMCLLSVFGMEKEVLQRGQRLVPLDSCDDDDDVGGGGDSDGCGGGGGGGDDVVLE